MHQALYRRCPPYLAAYSAAVTSSRSAQLTLIGSSAPEQPRYRELEPSSEDGPSLFAVPTCGTAALARPLLLPKGSHDHRLDQQSAISNADEQMQALVPLSVSRY